MYYESQGTLSTETIAEAMEATEAALHDAGVPKRVSLRATILLEELFLRYQEQIGAEAGLSFSITRRFGTVRMRLEIEGPQLNALGSEATEDLDEGSDFVTVLMADELEPPTYAYRRGRNVVTLSVRVQRQQPFLANPMLVATVLAILAFLVLSRTDSGFSSTLVEDVVAPLISMLMGVLSAIAGPLLSLSLISGICALGDVNTLKSTGRHAIRRIMVWVILMFAASVAICLFFYRGAAGQVSTSFDPGELFELLLSSIPSNLFSPFVEGNSLQIAVESVFLGVCILAIGERSKHVRKLIVELNDLAFKMMYLFSEALPLLVGLSVFKTLMTTDMASLASIGVIVAINMGTVVILSAGALLWTLVSLHVSPATFLKKTFPVLAICLTTGSSTSAMGEFFRISEEELGVEKKIVDFWVPLGHAMFAPSVVVPLVVGMYAVSSMEGVAFGPTRVAILFVLVFQLSIATPKVPGGIAATFTILLGQLGLPLDSVGLLMAANVFVCNPEVAFGDLVRLAEICSFAQSEHALDEEKLHKAS